MNKKPTTYLTAEGAAKLEAELKELKKKQEGKTDLI